MPSCVTSTTVFDTEGGNVSRGGQEVRLRLNEKNNSKLLLCSSLSTILGLDRHEILQHTIILGGDCL